MRKHRKEIAFVLSAVTFCVILALIIVVSMRSHEKPKNDTQTYETISGLETERVPETMVYDDIVSEPVTEGLPEGISYKKVTSKTVINTENGSRVVYNYPRFEGFSTEKDASLNGFIKYYLDVKCKETGEGMYKLAAYGAKVIYEVTDFSVGYMDDKFMSLMFTGNYDIDYEGEHIDSGVRHFMYSMNVDMQDMELVTSSQLFANYMTLRTRMTEDKLSLVHGQEGLLGQTSYTVMLSQYSDKYEIYPDVYFEDDSVKIIVSLTAELGGCAVFSDSREAAKEYLNTYLSELSQYW